MKAVQISKPGGNFELVERPIPQPARGQVRIKVEACGICHSDALVKEGYWPGIQYPRVPGHEIAGRIDALGADVTLWKPGERSAWDGMAVTASSAIPAAAEISLTARTRKSPPFHSTAAIRNTWSRPPKRSPPCPTIYPPPKPRRCCARESPCITRCATRRRAAAIW